MKIKINLFNREFIFQLVSRDLRHKDTIGYTNRCSDGRYIIFLDYDNIRLDWLSKELEYLQDRFFLSAFHVFKSSKDSYHAVCFDKVSVHRYLDILRNSSVDSRYINIPLYFGKKIWTLRLSDKKDNKIKYLERIDPIVEGLHDQSSAHINFVNYYFNKAITDKKGDGEHEMVFSKYTL